MYTLFVVVACLRPCPEPFGCDCALLTPCAITLPVSVPMIVSVPFFCVWAWALLSVPLVMTVSFGSVYIRAFDHSCVYGDAWDLFVCAFSRD